MLVDDEVGLGSLHGHLGIVHLVGDAVTHQSLGVTEERRGRTTKDLVHLVLTGLKVYSDMQLGPHRKRLENQI